MEDSTEGFLGRLNDDGEEEEDSGRVFAELKPYCLELLELLRQSPSNRKASIHSFLNFLKSCPSPSLHPFFDYAVFPLLLLLDAAVNCRGASNNNNNNNNNYGKKTEEEEERIVPCHVSDGIAEGVVLCLEQLLLKCHLSSVQQMVVLMKKLTFAAMLSPTEASEEFREGVIKCFRALLVNLVACYDECCSCRCAPADPILLDGIDMMSSVTKPSKYHTEGGECLLAFLQSPPASAAVGHWLSLLLKAADIEAARGQRGSAKIRVEAFLTIRVLVAKIGTADALAFFLPGVVSQFAKALHVAKTMISGAAGSVEAIDQALRGLAEYLIVVLKDDANLSSVDFDVLPEFGSNKIGSSYLVLHELRQLPIDAQGHGNIVIKPLIGRTESSVTNSSELKEGDSTKFSKEIRSFHVDRTREWIEKTSVHVDKLLTAIFPHICVHPSKKVRQGLVAAVRGLLSKCSYTLKASRLMLLECLFVMIVDDSEEVSAPAQQFLEHLLFESVKHHVKCDIAEIFSRLIGKLPKVVLGNDKSLALSHAQKVLVVVYYCGPQFLLDHLNSPVVAAKFLDVFALCLSPNSLYNGALGKHFLARPSSVGYLQSISELKGVSPIPIDQHSIMNFVPSDIMKFKDVKEGEQYHQERMRTTHDLPCIPPWFVHVGCQELYQALAATLRLVGLSLMTDITQEGHINVLADMSIITDIPLSYLRKLVSEVREKEHSKESWQSWYLRTGSGQLLRQASTAVCILNEIMFGSSERSVETVVRIFGKSRGSFGNLNARDVSNPPCAVELPHFSKSIWAVSEEKAARSHLIDCIGRILHEYLSSEVWDLPIDIESSLSADSEFEEITLHFFHDAAMLQQVIVEGIGIFALCLGNDFVSCGFLQSSFYPLLEILVCSNVQVRGASDAVLHILATMSGYSTVGQLVLANADYVIDSICRQLRHLDLNPHVPNVLASMLSYIGASQKILPLLEEPMFSASQELEILGRHQHPELTVSFLKAVAEIAKATNREASLLPSSAEAYLMHVKCQIVGIETKGLDNSQDSSSPLDKDSYMSHIESECETTVFKLNDSKRYRRIVGSIASSCLVAAIPLLASMKQDECLVALGIIEDGIAALARVEEAYRHERETREAIEEVIQLYSLYPLQDTMDAAEEGTDENRLLPAMNKIWPFLVACVRNKNPVAVRRCLSVVANVVQICGGNFFSRRFHTDGLHFWKLLSTSPFRRKPFSKDERIPLQLPYRSTPNSSEDSMAEVSNVKIQVAALNMIAELSRNKKSSSALEVVLKKVSGLVVGMVCSGVSGLRDASTSALLGLASVDPDLIWLLVADVYYSIKNKDLPSPPTSDLPDLFHVLPPPPSPKDYLYVKYGGQSYGFDIDLSAVETAFNMLAHPGFSKEKCM